MSQFQLPLPATAANQSKTVSENSGGIKLQVEKMYNARLETLGNQLTQVKVATGKQTLTLPLPTQPLPAAIKAGQNYQISLSPGKDGQTAIQFFPQPGSTASSQTVKLPLSPAQLLSLLSLGKAFNTSPNGSITTVGQISGGNRQPLALKLPGLATAIKLPPDMALLKNSKTVDVAISVKGNKIELQLSSDAKNPQAVKFTLPLPADKLAQMARQQLAQLPGQALKITAAGAKSPGSSQIELPNQPALKLPGKPSPDSKITVQNLNRQTLTIKVAQPADAGSKPLATLTLNRPLLNTEASASADKSAATMARSPGPLPSAQPGSETSDVSDDINAAMSGRSNAESNAKLAEQKQVLSKLIDPLIRLLLPRKLNWSEGLKTLATLEQQLSQAKPPADGEEAPQLKQLLNQIRSSIPEQNPPLNGEKLSAMISQLLNFNPGKVSTPVQPTPANAIASALQLLLGSKLVQQSEGKTSPQLQQQLTALLKPLLDKTTQTSKEGKGIKAMTNAMAQTEQGSNSLKTLVGLQSGIRHQQLENVEKRLDGNSQLDINLPLKFGDEFKEVKISISEEKSQTGKKRKKTSLWQLNLTFDLDALGKLLVNAKLKDGEVSMHLYAEQQKTLILMNKFSDILAQRLETQGVKINNIQSSLGKISDNKGSKPLNSLLQITV